MEFLVNIHAIYTCTYTFLLRFRIGELCWDWQQAGSNQLQGGQLNLKVK